MSDGDYVHQPPSAENAHVPRSHPIVGRIEKLRHFRGWMLSRTSHRRVISLEGDVVFVVPSVTRPGISYDVFIDEDGIIKCLCPDYTSRAEACQHVVETLYRFFPKIAPPTPSKQTISAIKPSEYYAGARRIHKPPFPYKEGLAESTRHDQAIAGQDDRLDELLLDLAGAIDGGKCNTPPGRPSLSAGEMIAVLVLRQHHKKSMRGTRALLTRRGLARNIRFLPCKNTLISYMASPKTTKILQKAFAITVRPFRLMEQDVVIDSSGFSPWFFECWRETDHNELSFAGTQWLKVHLAIGRLSKAILGFIMTPNEGKDTGDPTNLMPLLKRIRADDFDLRYVIVDNVYLDKERVNGVASLDAQLVAPIKKKNRDKHGNVHAGIRSVEAFARRNPELYDELLRARQPIEGIFSVEKRDENRIKAIGSALERGEAKAGRRDGLYTARLNEMWIRMIRRNLLQINIEEHLRNRRISFAKGSMFSHVREIIETDEAA